ncbi:hypothetical protein K439DRAFT_1253224, partial [Ramaria rubella]
EEAEVVSILTDQKELGNQAKSGWKPIVWTAVVAALAATFDTVPQKNVKQCKSRWQRVRHLFIFPTIWLIHSLHEQSGFGWDDMKQMVTTPPDVWDKYLE